MISPDTAEAVHNIPLSSDSESEAVPLSPPRKNKPAPPEATVMLLPLSSKGLRMRGPPAERSVPGSLVFEDWQAALQEFFPATLTRLLNKWEGWRREAEKGKISKRHVAIWQVF